MALRHPRGPNERGRQLADDEIFTSEMPRVPRHQMPAGETPPEVAYQIVHDELMLDGNARLNLATFVTHVDGAAGRPAHGRDASTRT